MTPQERQLVDDLFDRLAKVESAPRDADASAAIQDGLRKAPNAIYALVQTVLVQDEALKRAAARIQELEQAHAPEQTQSGGFLDSMRDTVFGKEQRGSVPNVPPPVPNRPVWNSGQVLQQSQGRYDQPHYDQGPYPQGYPQGGGFGQGGFGQGGFGGPGGGPPGGGFGAPFGGGGGSFLGTAAAAAAGMVGGSLLLNGIRGMMGGGHHQQTFADAGGSSGGSSSPWSDQSNSSLARDAGINDIGRSDGGSRNTMFDQAALDRQQDAEQDAMDDAGDYGDDDNGSDYA
jgi:uncharacterized protein